MEPEKPNAPITRRPRRRLWTILLALAIFLGGVFVGGGVTFKIIASGYKRAFLEPEVLAERIIRRMERRLDLNTNQVKRAGEIILEQQRAFQALRREFRPRLDSQIEKTRRELAEVLTPEQARKWDNSFKRLQRFWMPPLPAEFYPPDSGGGKR